MSRLFGRLVCRLRGEHENVGTFLPEEPFGYSAYSKLWCRRCGRVDAEYPIEDQIDVLMGYVTLWNDVRPIVEAARALIRLEWAESKEGLALIDAIAKYEDLYPEHIAA